MALLSGAGAGAAAGDDDPPADVATKAAVAVSIVRGWWNFATQRSRTCAAKPYLHNVQERALLRFKVSKVLVNLVALGASAAATP